VTAVLIILGTLIACVLTGVLVGYVWAVGTARTDEALEMLDDIDRMDAVYGPGEN
jgi:hypothetical protein